MLVSNSKGEVLPSVAVCLQPYLRQPAPLLCAGGDGCSPSVHSFVTGGGSKQPPTDSRNKVGFLWLLEQADVTEHMQRAKPLATKGTLPGDEFGRVLVKICYISTGAQKDLGLLLLSLA